MNNMPQNKEEEEKKAIYNSIISELKSFSNFDDEFFVMVNILQPNSNESNRKFTQVCQDVRKAIVNRYPHVKVQPFGSRVTGLDFPNSDIDIYLGNIQYDDEITPLNEIKNRLQANGFGNCILIPAAVSIITCTHLETGIKCDVKVKNILGVCTSQLVSYYLGVDVNVKRTMIVLKYWADCRRLTGKYPLFTNNALVMMFIFFLQQAPYNLPSVNSLQKTSNFVNVNSGVWNGNFIPDYDFNKNHLMQLSILDLLKQFFSFYGTFPYDTDIICPYLGRNFPKKNFMTSKELPDSYRIYKMQPEELIINNNMCLQDPFEHCRNLCRSVAKATVEKFVTECLFALSICEKNDKHILYKLLTEPLPNDTKAL